jgi:hypothetical protein
MKKQRPRAKGQIQVIEEAKGIPRSEKTPYGSEIQMLSTTQRGLRTVQDQRPSVVRGQVLERPAFRINTG